jgi:hypothetical protein
MDGDQASYKPAYATILRPKHIVVLRNATFVHGSENINLLDEPFDKTKKTQLNVYETKDVGIYSVYFQTDGNYVWIMDVKYSTFYRLWM